MSDERTPQGTGGASTTPEIGVTHRTDLSFTLDEEKIQAIRACLEKGELRITVIGANLTTSGRFQAAYIYD
jgi:hypothetical protein